MITRKFVLVQTCPLNGQINSWIVKHVRKFPFLSLTTVETLYFTVMKYERKGTVV